VWDKLFSLLAPFAVIARELTILRELYELDLGSRQPPLYRITETPSIRDTEVSYAGEKDDTPKHKKWFSPIDVEDEFDDSDDVESKDD